jgi:predicted lipoprotein with Yx(FWY)xxD motif
MPVSRASQQTLRALLSASALGLSFVPACVADEPGITDNETAGTSSSGKTSKAGSSSTSAGTSSDAGAAPSGVAGSGQAGSAVTPVGGGAGGSGESDVGGAPTHVGEGGQMNGQGGQGEGGAGTPPVAMKCIFHTDAGADPGAGGAPADPTVVLQSNAFVGSYLTDADGRTLYTYGADLPGDCQTAPTSGCTADCLVTWPVFDAGSRVLGAGLDDAAFGAFDRGDGTWQTTYYGWPLYYNKSDLTLGQLTGQGKGKTWHAAELTPASVVIMKAGTAKYLGDAAGHTLYVSAADQLGTEQVDPVSACEGDCLSRFTPFREKHLSVVTSLEEADFSVFVRHASGGLQLAYKGLPLYSANTDLKSGDMTGLSSSGFIAAVP